MFCFIVNPAAGGGRALAAMQRVGEVLTRHGAAFKTLTCEYSGHATLLAREAAQQGYRAVVAVGGDGTVAEVAQGLVGTGQTMGIIPAGTGNDYRRSLDIPSAAEGAAEVLLAGNTRLMDGVRMDGRLFLNVAHGGFDVEVIRNTEKFKFIGGLSYYISAVYTAFKRYCTRARITFDDGEVFEDRLLLMSVGCGKYYGGGMKVLPGASGDDGQLEVLYVDAVSTLKILRLLPDFISGKHYRCSFAHHRKCRWARLEVFEENFYAAGDGEVLGQISSALFEVEPAAVRVLCGQKTEG